VIILYFVYIYEEVSGHCCVGFNIRIKIAVSCEMPMVFVFVFFQDFCSCSIYYLFNGQAGDTHACHVNPISHYDCWLFVSMAKSKSGISACRYLLVLL
jgi:hypothetical protein